MKKFRDIFNEKFFMIDGFIMMLLLILQWAFGNTNGMILCGFAMVFCFITVIMDRTDNHDQK